MLRGRYGLTSKYKKSKQIATSSGGNDQDFREMKGVIWRIVKGIRIIWKSTRKEYDNYVEELY